MKLPRLAGTILIANILLVAVFLLAPQKLPLVLYKFALLAAGGVGGYWLDWRTSPYARPHSYLVDRSKIPPGVYVGGVEYSIDSGYRLVFAAAMLRRAIIIGSSILAVALCL